MKKIYFIVAIVLFLIACKSENKQNKETIPFNVNYALVKNYNGAKPVYSTGIVQKDNHINLSFKTGGIIADINVDEGDVVKRNQVLARLNSEEINAKVQQALAALNKAKRDFKRAENLFKDTVATKEQYQDSRTALNVAQADYNAAIFNQQHAIIRSPENGIVLYKLAEENEVIAAGHPVIILGSGESDFIVKSNITDKAYVKIKTGDTAKVQIDAYKDLSFNAFVKHISPVSDPVTGTYNIDLNFMEKPSKLAVGMIAKVIVIPSATTPLMKIPVDALLEANGDVGYVYVSNNGLASRRKIEISHFDSEFIYIHKGLSINDKVITSGKDKLEEGKKVELIDQ